jgi:hypothetical protein
MNGVVVKMVGSKLVVEVDILKAIAEGVGGARPVSTVKPGPLSPRPPARQRRKRTPGRPGRVPHGQGQHLWGLTPSCLDGS